MLDKIAEVFGGDSTHYRQLRKVEKTVATRAVDAESERGFARVSLGITCLFCFFYSAAIAMTVFFLPLDTFSYTLLTLSSTMGLVVLLILPHFDIILSPTNYLVVSHTPVSSRTYFIVKLTQLLTYAVLLLGCLNLLPAIFGMWAKEQNPFFPVVYLPISFIAGFFMIGLMTVFAGYLAKLYTKERFRNIAQYAQLAFTISFPAICILGPRFSRELATDTDNVVSLFKAFYLLPNSWFAGAVPLVLGNAHHQFLILTALAMAAIVLLVAGPLRSIAKSYSKYLASLSEARRTRSSQLKIRTSVVARLFRGCETRATADLVFAYLRRDRTTQFRFLCELGTIVILIILILFQNNDLFLNSIGKTFTIWLALGVSGLFFLIGSGFIGSFLGQIRYSEHRRAAWMFRCASLAVPHALWRGVQATALVYMVFPYTLLLTTVATFLWPSFWGGFYLLPGVVGLFCYVVLHPKPSSGLPLSQEYSQRKRYVESIPYLCGLLTFGAVLILQLVMYKIHLGLYIACYSVTIIAGVLLFIYFFEKKEEQISKNQIGVEAYTPNSI